MRIRLLAVIGLLGASLAHGQAPATPASPDDGCAAVRTSAPETDARALAVRSQCVLAGVIPSTRRFEEARELAAKSLALGDAAGGYLLYLAFNNDPQHSYMRDGKADVALYRKLAERPLAQRQEQVAAIDGLAFAVGRGHMQGAMLLATYLYGTTAPQNAQRLRSLTEMLLQSGERTPVVETMARQSADVTQRFAATKVSLQTFGEAFRTATTAATAAYRARNPGRTCTAANLKGIRSGPLQDAEFLPLKERPVAGSFLVRGRWQEEWLFSLCGLDVPVDLAFRADGWGGALFDVAGRKTN